MGLILDTSVFVEFERKKKPIDFSTWVGYGAAYISVITVSALLLGAHFADNKTRQIKQSAFVESILANIPALGFTSETARIHAELYTHLSKMGKLLGAHDLMIAATAVAHGFALVTCNHKDFENIPGLKVLAV